jgi:hypothetical protein
MTAIAPLRRALLALAVALVLLVPLAATGAAATSSAPGRNSPTSTRRGGDLATVVIWIVAGLVVAGAIAGGVYVAYRRRDVAGSGQPEDAPPKGP